MLKRAVELSERDEPEVHGDGISEQALTEAADELGLDVGAVRRAAAEERLGVLGGERRLLDRLAGPACISATRVVERPASELFGVVDQWLRRDGVLRRRRLDDRTMSAEYSRRSDPAASFQRFVRSVRGREQLGRVRRLRVVVRAVDDDRSVVALVADLELERTVTVGAGSSVAGVGSALSVAEAVTGTRWLWLGVPASAAAGLGVLRWRAAGLPDVEAALQGVLDRVAVHEPTAGVLADVRDRLRSGLTRPRRSA